MNHVRHLLKAAVAAAVLAVAASAAFADGAKIFVIGGKAIGLVSVSAFDRSVDRTMV